jgi:hypothetical protein
MRADSSRATWAGLLLALALLSTGCVSLTPPPGQRMNLRYTARGAAASAEGPSGTSVTAAGPDSAEKTARPDALAAQLAFRGAVLDVSGSTRRISAELSQLKASGWGIAGTNGVFLPFVDEGKRHLRWIDAQLAAAAQLANAASEVNDADMQLALLRLAGPRLEAAMMGSLLLAVWVDFLHLADVALAQRLYPVERLILDMYRWQARLEPAMTALASLEPGQVEATAKDLPSLVGHLTSEFAAAQERMRVAAEKLQKVLVLTQAIFCVELEQAHHEAIHGGGDWKLGRTWAGEWNRMIMSNLRDAEMLAGRELTRAEILERVAFHMKRYDLPMKFSPWRGR